MGATPLLIAVKYGDHGGVAELAYAGVLKTLAGRLVGSNPTAPTINETDAGPLGSRLFTAPMDSSPRGREREAGAAHLAQMLTFGQFSHAPRCDNRTKRSVCHLALRRYE